jgi:hypothetical protein
VPSAAGAAAMTGAVISNAASPGHTIRWNFLLTATTSVFTGYTTRWQALA